MSCATVDIEVCQGADWSLVVQYADEDGLFVDITSATITAGIWASFDGDLVTSPTVTKLDASRLTRTACALTRQRRGCCATPALLARS